MQAGKEELFSFPAFSFIKMQERRSVTLKAWKDDCVQHTNNLAELFLGNDPDYQEREQELKEALQDMEPLIKAMGHEVWLKYDRVLTAHNSCESYAAQLMYAKGVQAAIELLCGKEK